MAHPTRKFESRIKIKRRYQEYPRSSASIRGSSSFSCRVKHGNPASDFELCTPLSTISPRWSSGFTTPDDLYRQAEDRAAYDHREIKDMVSDGLQLVLGDGRRNSSRDKALAALESVRRHPPRMSRPMTCRRNGDAVRFAHDG
jgi:hypothetical protein